MGTDNQNKNQPNKTGQQMPNDERQKQSGGGQQQQQRDSSRQNQNR